jgi:hypothetical protein
LLPLNLGGEQRPPHPNDRVVPAYPVGWGDLSQDASIFPDVRSGDPRRLLIDRRKLFAALRRRLSDEERATIANVAGDTLWPAFDRLARAPRIDVVSASLTFPLDTRRSASDLPIPRALRLNELSDGAAYRALHHAAGGHRDSAEAAIGALYAIGRRIAVDGTSLIEAFIGQRMAMDAVDLWRALHEYAPRRGSDSIVVAATRIRARADSVRDARRALADSGTGRARSDLRQLTLAMAADSTLERPVRIEVLGIAGYASCASLRELLFGPAKQLRDARANALATLAYSATDSAYFAYLDAQTEDARFSSTSRGWYPAFLRGTGAALSAVTTNPRFRSCADMLASMNY